MERWAKSLNQKKELTKMPMMSDSLMQSNGISTSSSADIGFAVLEKKNVATTSQMNVFAAGQQKTETVYQNPKAQVSFSFIT